MPVDPNNQRAIDEQNVYIRDTLMGIASNYANVLKDAVENAFDASEASTVAAVGKDLTRSFTKLVKMSDEFAHNQTKIKAGLLTEKDINKQLQSLQEKREELARRVLHARRIGAPIDIAELKNAKEALDVQKQQLEVEQNQILEIEKRLGLTGKLVQGIRSIPGIGKFFKAEEIEVKMRQVAASGGGTFATLGSAANLMGKQLVSGLTDPLTLITAIFTAANKADKQTTELAKSLTLTKDQAAGVREQFASFSRNIDDTAITTDKLLAAFSQLTKQLGFNVPRSKDLLAEFTKLTTKMGVSEEAAAGLSKLTLATGKNARAVTTEALGTASALQAQNGIQLDNREILNDVGKVSGQLLANFKGNPKAIAEAVTQTKLLGTTLEQTKAQAESLLNFESSIENELKAELLTGRELNLENARMAALKGDQASVAKELANQAMDFNAFSELNVVQQKALAESLGLSADQLSDQLLKQQMLGKSRSEIVAIGGEEAAQRLEQLAAQDKFNNAVEKLKDLLGNLVAGPLGQMLDAFGNIVGMISGIMTPFMALYEFTSKIGEKLGGWLDSLGMVGKILKGIAGMAIIWAAYSAFQSLASNPMLNIIPGAGIAAGLVAAASITAGGFGLLNSQKADDMVGYGARTLITPQGSVALNNNDTVIAGTNLFKGDDVISYPKNALSLGGGSDNTETNNLLKQLIGTTKENNSKPGIVNMDGRAVGSTLVQGSYKLA